jgi:hypothetical protein
MDNNEPQTPALPDDAENIKTFADVGVVEAQAVEATELMPVPDSLQLPPAPETAMVVYESPPEASANAEEATPKEAEKAESTLRPQRPARLETFLTAIVLIAAATGITWGLARPATLLFPPTQEQVAQSGQSPDCRRVRFDVAQLLGERWRQTISACLRGSCENLREALIARNFPIATWQLLEEDSGQGCEVNAQGPAKSAECTRLLGRVEGVAKTVLLQVEGECRKKP